MENMSEIKPPLGASHNSAHVLHTSDESEPSWLEPQLELKGKNPSARNQKLAENEPEIFIFILFVFYFHLCT